MHRIRFWFVTFILLLCAALPVVAQKFQPKTIQFKGAPEYSDADLLAAAGLKMGTTLEFAEMKEHAQMLMSTGVFETLNFKFDGVDLIYNLVPSTALYTIRLENLPLTPGQELETKLHERFPLYHGKVPAQGGLLDGARGVLEEMLGAKGIKATVTAMPYTDPKTHREAAMSFIITSPPVRVGPIQLEGVSADLKAKLQKIADHETGQAFGTEDSAGNLEHAFEMFYADEGYAAAKAHAIRSGDPVVAADVIAIPFSVTIGEGRLYKLGFIHLPADAPVAQAEFDKTFGSKTNPAKGQTLRDTWFLISSRYKAKGYLDCAVIPHPEIDEASGTVNYTVEVNPGQVYHLAFVKFENVSDELRSHLMRVWQMLPGDVFDESYLAGFIFKAQKEDPVLMRSLSGVGLTYKIAADPQTHEVNCTLRFAKLQQAP